MIKGGTLLGKGAIYDLPLASRRFQGTSSDAMMGFSVAGPGDVKGTIYSDLLVGAPYASPAGRAVLKNGGIPIALGTSASITPVSESFSGVNGVVGMAGWTVGGGGDAGGSSRNDVVIGGITSANQNVAALFLSA